jgi:glycosidase
MKKSLLKLLTIKLVLLYLQVYSQDSVAVTFYYKPSGNPSIVYLAGTFNNWANNNNGIISDPAFSMNYDTQNKTWYRTVKLLPAIYYYKFNEYGNFWITDPMNLKFDASYDNNSIINVTDPTIFYLQAQGTLSPGVPGSISCYLFSSDNNPINPDSIFVSVNDFLFRDVRKYYDTTKKLLAFPTILFDGVYKIKVIIKSNNGQIVEDSTTIYPHEMPYVSAIPFDFIFDPKSSYNTNKNITSVNLPGTFNGWNTSANPMTYISEDDVWKTTIDLLPGEYEYKFFLNNSIWSEDPDNPINRGSYNNSVAIVKSVDTIFFKDFSSPNGIILPDTISEFSLSTKIYYASINSTIINPASILVFYNGKPINYTYKESGQIVSVNLNKDQLKQGIHNLIFQYSGYFGNTIGKQSFSFGVYPSGVGYNYIDDFEDENFAYPDYIPDGSADIESFNINTNSSLDSLIFTIKMNKISDYTRVGFQVFNTISGKYTSEIPNINLQTEDWSDQGIFIPLMNPSSSFCDTNQQNIIYLSKNPITKGKRITLEKDSLSKSKFVFTLSLADLEDLMGHYTDKRYYTIYSYLSDNAGNDLQINSDGLQSNQPMVYDIAFARKFIQNILLSNHNQTRIARLDAEGRGIIGILPEQINPDLKSGLPIVKILTRSNLEMHDSFKVIEGTVDDLSISTVDTYRNNQRFSYAPITDGKFSAYVSLSEGDNLIKVTAKNSKGQVSSSNSLRLRYIVDHSPKPKIDFVEQGTNISIDASGSTDPDNDIVTYSWQSDDKINPLPLNISRNEKLFQLSKPAKAGEYYFILKVTDKNGNASTVRNYFILDSIGNLTLPDINSNPQWVKDAIVYEVFVKSFSQEGNINAVTKKIQYLKDIGVNTIWLMPIMHNQSDISEIGGGYGIDDFYNIAPQYGTLNDFKTLIDSTHSNGIKVVLDITENHVADRHPWVMDIRSFGKYSNYYDFIERRKLGDDRGMGQSLSSDGIYMHYGNWSLANLNLENYETKIYMIKMFKWWLVDQNSDGFRFDVYWGPQNRYGKDAFWRPVRNELKNVKPDIFLLGETDGTGTGSETNYSDGGGACDAAYDWAFYSTAKSIFSSGDINGLHNKVINYNYYPGNNSYFFRFLENHDEDRIAGLVNIEKNKSLIALLMTVPGIPMIYMGQEVGWTGRRNPVDFNNSSGDILLPYYKRIVNARKKFPAFRTKTIKRINSGDAQIYAYIRPFKDENALVLLNFSNTQKSITLNINESADLILSSPLDETKDYYLNDFSNDAYYKIKKSDLLNLQFSLSPNEAKVMILSDKVIRIKTSVGRNDGNGIPSCSILKQNYPNPFNPITWIDYSISEPGNVKIIVYDMLGREIKTLVNEFKNPGEYKIYFDASETSNGMYFYKLFSNSYSEIRKMIVLK